VSVEPGIVIAAAIAMDALWRRVASSRATSPDSVEPPAVGEAVDPPDPVERTHVHR
jgi:hypothetical protein